MIKDTRLFWLLTIMMLIAQLSIPAKMIYNQKQVQLKGTTYKFELNAIDPTDPFRGKYIILNPKEPTVHSDITNPSKPTFQYATFTKNKKGFAIVDQILIDKPTHSDYLKVKTISRVNSDQNIFIIYPFDRYYLNEEKALPAEILIREILADSLQTTYAEVKILDGKHSLLDVKINEQSLNDLLDN